MSKIQEKIVRHAKNKEMFFFFIFRGKKGIEIVFGCPQMLDWVSKDFKTGIIKMFKEL